MHRVRKRFMNSVLLVLTSVFIYSQNTSSFKETQLKFARVKKAYNAKYQEIKKEVEKAGFSINSLEVFIRAFKKEKELELWMKNKTDKTFKHYKTFSICASSGDPGPKRRQGDGQVPEGFYFIEAFNPSSLYHLSMKVNYPNASDKIRANGKPGGDIMIHGECVTIGCLPIENDPIEELYIICVEAKNSGQKIPVHIFPLKFNDSKNTRLIEKQNKEIQSFWNELKEGYQFFENSYKLPLITVNKQGAYVFTK